MTFTVYTKAACVQCQATERALDKKGLVEGIDYQTVYVDQDAAALDRLKELGFQQAPVIVTENDSWSGFRPDKIAGLTPIAA